MASIDYPLSGDEFDDLPRTIRREREAREREARDREAFGRADPPFVSRAGPAPEYGGAFAAAPDYAGAAYAGEPVSAIVKRFDVPFIRLAAFFLKAVVAAIPALILLGAIIWLAGDILQTYFPSLLKMQIFIHFPE
jgi:hypothetical protein